MEIYKNYGFELKEEAKVSGTDLTLYAMLRTAKTNKETIRGGYERNK